MTEQIFAHLKEDHDRHRVLLQQIDDAASGKSRAKIFDAFRIEVTAHAAAEEETLYATMLAKPDLRHDAQHSVSEHKEIEDFLEEIETLDPASEAWLSKFGEMRKRYLHHIGEEEEEMFPAAEEGLSEERIKEISERFANRKPAELERAKYGADAGDDRD